MTNTSRWIRKAYTNRPYITYSYRDETGNMLKLLGLEEETTTGKLWYGSRTSFLKATNFVDGYAMVGVGTVKYLNSTEVETAVKFWLVINENGKILHKITACENKGQPTRRGNEFYYKNNDGSFYYDAGKDCVKVKTTARAEDEIENV